MMAGGSIFLLSIVLTVLIQNLDSLFLRFLKSFGLKIVFIAIFQHYRHGKEKVEPEKVTKRINLKAESYS